MSQSDMTSDSVSTSASAEGEQGTTDNSTDEISFADAMSELNRIVVELESDSLDVDLLADRVERAAFLVSTCRNRLDATRLRVEEILVRLDEPAPSVGDEGE